MTILTTYGRSLYVLNLMYINFFSPFAPTSKHTLAYLFALFNVTTGASSTTSPTALFFSPMAFFYAFLVPIPPLKTGRPSALFVPSTISYALYLSKHLFLPVFGSKLCALLPFFLTSAPPKPVLAIHPFNLFFYLIPTTFLFGSLVAYAFLTSHPSHLTN